MELALLLAALLVCLLGAAAWWVDGRVREALQREEERQAYLHGETLLASLQTLMLAGQGTLARRWIDRMHAAPGIEDVEVLRRDGSEAFTDLSTMERVNAYLGRPRFRREPARPHHQGPSHPGAFRRALAGAPAVARDARGALTLYLPIPAQAACQSCHGYDRHPLRGVLRLTLAPGEAERRLAAVRAWLWGGAFLLAGVLGLALWAALYRQVLAPLARLRWALARAGRGDRRLRLPAGPDELGQVAAAFNRMQGLLEAGEARLKAVADSVMDAILTIDERGRIESANRAVKEVFGYLPQELQGRNVAELMPEPYRSRHGQFLRRYLETGEARVIGRRQELQALRRDGTVFPVEVSVGELRAEGRRRFVGVVRDISERKRQEEAMRRQALHDALTGLPNRALLADRLAQALAQAGRRGEPLALALMDLDHFKEVNDTLGHHVGDQLLQQVAGRLSQAVRGTDTVARLGGDEFAVLLPGVGRREAERVVGKLLEVFRRPFVLQGHPFALEASVGVALFPEHGTDGQLLLQRADVAMYEAKRRREGLACYDPSRDRHDPGSLSLLAELRQALEGIPEARRPAGAPDGAPGGGLLLHFQPQVELATGRVAAAEALVRWRHPARGLLPPAAFVPLAERGGLVRPFTLAVLELAVAALRRWRERGLGLRLSANLPPRLLLDGELPERLQALLEGAGVPGRCLCLEVTESAMLSDPDQARRVLEGLDALGVELAVDDFGTGYSSLAQLQRLPVRELKVDRSFVQGMAADPAKARLVEATVALGRRLGLRVVAEGVEEEAARRMLLGMGCDLAQGYLFARPLEEAALLAWLEGRSVTAVSGCTGR
ncbi:MAG: EAL domain-containing protein [Gammaproteobacteria bacterium]|nr:MAG: EAL domain-containing protein [Gammaproteobacteria bacterium]